ncbi:MAG: hypothetical protein M1829_003339 [Trizodia sp. TS-e1964]|nr:MAG: hypothetical protein M1829_003339 [Trizodia sp. TS-e1964]
MKLLSSILPLFSLASATLLVDYHGGESVSKLGIYSLEGQNLGDHIDGPGTSSCFIKPGVDPSGRAALHFHREAHFRRAEVEGIKQYGANQNYFVGYNFMLQRSHDSLVIFQWKKDDKLSHPIQNIPFNIEFSGGNLRVQYQEPSNGAVENGYTVLWTDTSALALNTPHHIGIAWDTFDGHRNRLRLWLDGAKKLDKSGLNLWTGQTYTKFGIYRGELAAGQKANPEQHVFDSYVYRVQVSDKALAEVMDASGGIS